ncbi:MAG: response regulator [Desulfobacterales bacterium]|nr:response regulator [Desulfobacterales bacterium]
MAFKMLVVDDSLPMRSIVIRTIKASGFSDAEFLQAGNGKEALEILANEWVDLVVTDYNMPDMNGMELIQEMKKDDILHAIPVLVVTTEGSQQKAGEFIEKGAAGYVKKPFTPEAIRDHITKILGEVGDEGSAEEGDDDLDF